MQTKWIVGALVHASLATAAPAHAATFQTFVDDQPGFLAAIGSGTVSTHEDFAAAVDLQTIGAAGTPDSWSGFTVEAYGPNAGTPWSPSKYCQALNSISCINWNTMAPATPGVYAAVNIDNGVSFKPLDPTIAGFSFDFVDWNDQSQRSNLIIFASDGTSTIVSGPANLPNAPIQTFGVTLSPADIAAGLHIQEMRWIGLNSLGEVVGFLNVQTYTNPVITNTPPIANPDTYPMPNGPFILDLLGNDSDPDGDVLQVTSINGLAVTPGIAQSIPVTSGTVEIAIDGTITFIPESNANGPVSFPYEIGDGRGGTSNSTVMITAKPIPPIASPAPIPSLGNWALVGLSSLIAIFGLIRRRNH